MTDSSGRLSLWQGIHNSARSAYHILHSHMKYLSDFLFLSSSSLIATCGDGVESRCVCVYWYKIGIGTCVWVWFMYWCKYRHRHVCGCGLCAGVNVWVWFVCWCKYWLVGVVCVLVKYWHMLVGVVYVVSVVTNVFVFTRPSSVCLCVLHVFGHFLEGMTPPSCDSPSLFSHM